MRRAVLQAYIVLNEAQRLNVWNGRSINYLFGPFLLGAMSMERKI
jgi:hypothetical protein